MSAIKIMVENPCKGGTYKVERELLGDESAFGAGYYRISFMQAGSGVWIQDGCLEGFDSFDASGAALLRSLERCGAFLADSPFTAIGDAVLVERR